MRYADGMKPAPSLFRRRLKAKVQAQKNIRLEAARFDALSSRIAKAYAGMQVEEGLAEIDSIVSQERAGTMPDLEDTKRRRADEGSEGVSEHE